MSGEPPSAYACCYDPSNRLMYCPAVRRSLRPGRDERRRGRRPGARTRSALPGVPRVPLATVLREWGRIGCIGFGGPPAHIRLLRQLCVERRGWLDAREFEDAIAVCNLMPGPASTQLAIFCAWRLRGGRGRWSAGPRLSCPGWSSSWPWRCCSWRTRRRCGCSAPGPARARPCPRWRSRPGGRCSGRAGGTRRPPSAG